MKKAGKEGSEALERRRRLAHLRALAHPLRLRLAELFAEAPRTTKQAAKVLGEPPTRLYHHVHLLEKAGLLRLTETRRKRGTEEKYYEVVPSVGQEGTIEGTSKTGVTRKDYLTVAGAVLEATRLDLTAQPGWRRGVGKGPGPLIARVHLRSPEEARALRTELAGIIKGRVAGKASRSGSKTSELDMGERWTLTVLLLPSGRRKNR